MINSRDSYTAYTGFNPNRKESIEVPYGIGTIVELKDNPDVLARIIQYRITVEHFRQIINVGLNTNIYEDEDKIDCEITVEELEEKWKKPDRIIVGKLNPENFIQIPGFSEHFEREKKLELTRKRKNK